MAQARQCRRLISAGHHGRALRRHRWSAVRLRYWVRTPPNIYQMILIVTRSCRALAMAYRRGGDEMLTESDGSTINGILAMQSFRTQFSTGYMEDKVPGIAPSQSSLIVAILSLGTIFGSLFAAPGGDTFGRRRSLIASVGVFCFGVIFQVCAHDIPVLLVGRYVDRPPLSLRSREPKVLIGYRLDFSLVLAWGQYPSSFHSINQRWRPSGFEERWCARTNCPLRWAFSLPQSSTYLPMR